MPAIDLKDIVQKFTRFDSKAVSANIKIGRNQVKHEKDDSDNSVNAESSASTIQNVIGALWKSSERKQAIPKWKQKARPIVSKVSKFFLQLFVSSFTSQNFNCHVCVCVINVLQ